MNLIQRVLYNNEELNVCCIKLIDIDRKVLNVKSDVKRSTILIKPKLCEPPHITITKLGTHKLNVESKVLRSPHIVHVSVQSPIEIKLVQVNTKVPQMSQSCTVDIPSVSDIHEITDIIDVKDTKVETELNSGLLEESLFELVFEFKSPSLGGNSFSSVKPDRFVVFYVSESLGRDWESPLLRIFSDICSLIAETIVGQYQKPRDYTLSNKDRMEDPIPTILLEHVEPGVILVIRSEKCLDEKYIRNILREADRARVLGFLVINRSAIPENVWREEVEIQPGHRLDIIIRPKVSFEELKKMLCIVAAALSGFSINEKDLMNQVSKNVLAFEKIVSIAIGVFRRILERVNNDLVVAMLNKPSVGEQESVLHRLLKGWAISWVIKKFFNDNIDLARNRIHVEEQLPCGVPDIYVELPNGKKMIVEVKTLLGKGVNPIWDELYHNEQIRRYAYYADEVLIIVPPWIPVLYTKALINVQRTLWQDKDQTLRRVKIVTLYTTSNKNDIIPIVKYIKIVKHKLKK
ncbi:MAG: hypothetical protein GXO26_01420 [Crenarchaeota archaeon]|nr:hypothetical protein [Thermoproteota archaeon]